MKRWILRGLLGVLLSFSVMTSVVPTTVYAEPTEETEDKDEDEEKTSGGVKSQDGKERSEDEIFVDSGAPSSFKGAKYYDTAIPYNLTHDEVGGCSIEGTTPMNGYGGLFVMKDEVRKFKIGGTVQQMNGGSSWKVPNRAGGSFDNSKVEYGTDPDTGARILKDSNGVEYYLMAIQGIHFNAADAFFPFSAAFLGQVVDIILTDGTVIHMVATEANSNNHTNGTVDGSSTETVDGILVVDELKMEQYRNLFQACNAGQIELINTGATKFAEKYNIGTGEGQNRIMYYRMYNFKADNAPEPASEDVKGLDYKLKVDGQTVGSGTEEEQEVVEFSQTGLFEETHYVKWKAQEEWIAYMAQLEDMNDGDIYEVENWKNDLDKADSEGILIRGGRFISILFGILFEVWMMLIYLSYWFDRLNNFFDFSVLSILTFGRLRISPDESECTFSMTDLGKGEKRTVNHKKILEVCIIGLAFGALIVSGAIFSILQGLVNKVLSWLY